MQGNSSGDKQQQGGQKQSLSWSQPEQKAAQPNLSVKSLTSGPQKPAGAARSSAGLYTSIFIGGLIIGLLLGWGITSSRGNGSAGAATTNVAATSTVSQTSMTNTSAALSGSSAATGTPVLEGTASLQIPSPQAAGLTVVVSHAVVSQPTWVVVYEDHDGVAGNALGAALFYPESQGGQTSGTVDLLRGTTPGETYLVGESLDDGDHKFSLTLDKPVRDTQGNPVWVEFKTQ